MHRRINQKLSDIIHDDIDGPTQKPSTEEATDMQKDNPRSGSISTRQSKQIPGPPLSVSPRLAAVWNPNWQSDQSSQSGAQIRSQFTNNSDKYNNFPDELGDDEEILEQPNRQRIRSILKNNSSSNLTQSQKKRSKAINVRLPNFSNSKPKDLHNYNDDDNKSEKSPTNRKSLNDKEDSLVEFPSSVTDLDTYRRYLTRSPGNGADGGSKADDKAKAQMLVTRRTMALSQAIMSLTLLAISASQLRFVIEYENAQPFPNLNYFLLAICIITEIVGGIGYLILTRFQFREEVNDKIQSYLMIALFMVAIATIIISSFSLENHVCEAPNPDLKEPGPAPEQPSASS